MPSAVVQNIGYVEELDVSKLTNDCLVLLSLEYS